MLMIYKDTYYLYISTGVCFGRDNLSEYLPPHISSVRMVYDFNLIPVGAVAQGGIWKLTLVYLFIFCGK
ncbi:hypothetical protein SAMN04487773_1954 [Enterobacter sp. kpr-6]|nr:hypothetical protein SAMN04487773_1954 [Enterobacter sp. kpr-6]